MSTAALRRRSPRPAYRTLCSRVGWYIDNYTAQLPAYLEHGIVGAADDGRISGATRADYAEAAAVVLAEEGHAGATYELGGPAFTMTDLAEVVSAATGRLVTYTDMSVQGYTDFLVAAGLGMPCGSRICRQRPRRRRRASSYAETADLERLLGRPATSLRTAVDIAVRDLSESSGGWASTWRAPGLQMSAGGPVSASRQEPTSFPRRAATRPSQGRAPSGVGLMLPLLPHAGRLQVQLNQASGESDQGRADKGRRHERDQQSRTECDLTGRTRFGRTAPAGSSSRPGSRWSPCRAHPRRPDPPGSAWTGRS